MNTLEIIIIFAMFFWIVLYLMSIDDELRAIKYEQHEIYLLLEYYLHRREIEREKQKNDKSNYSKFIPKKKDITLAEKKDGHFEIFTKNYVQGWNDCIDEIIGEAER